MENKICNFCGENVAEYIEGENFCICYDCIDILSELKEMENYKKNNKNNKENILTPYEIKKGLDDYVVGQEDAKKKIAVEIYNHYKRINRENTLKIDLPKNNILFIGNSGCGKTYLMKCLGNLLDIPIVFGDANDLTASGYEGKSVDSLLKALIEKCNGDIEKAERGIIYIDEIDKIANIRDVEVSTKLVQQSLLSIMEGTEYFFDKDKNDILGSTSINTKNILFICSGAFVGLEDIIKKRFNKTSTIGFNVNGNDTKNDVSEGLLKKVSSKDLCEFGLIKEFVGRLSSVAVFDDLKKEDLKDILVKPKNSITKQYEALFEIDGISLKFDNEALDYIVDEAVDKNLGARGLKSVISDTMTNLMFDAPQSNVKEIQVTKELLEHKYNNL